MLDSFWTTAATFIHEHSTSLLIVSATIAGLVVAIQTWLAGPLQGREARRFVLFSLLGLLAIAINAVTTAVGNEDVKGYVSQGMVEFRGVCSEQVSRMLMIVRLRDECMKNPNSGCKPSAFWPDADWMNQQLSESGATWTVAIQGAEIRFVDPKSASNATEPSHRKLQPSPNH